MLLLVVNYIVIYDFCGSAADVIHLSNPLHLIVCFEFFGYAHTFCHLFYEPKKQILSLRIYIGKVSVQFAFCEQGRIKTSAVCHRSKSVLTSKYPLRVLITSALRPRKMLIKGLLQNFHFATVPSELFGFLPYCSNQIVLGMV